MKLQLLIIAANFYPEITRQLMVGARDMAKKTGMVVSTKLVPGVLEIPLALKLALNAREEGLIKFDACVVLGCVIRGDTHHYEIVANQSAQALMRLALDHSLALGNGILTVENSDQAWARADPNTTNKGAQAVMAAFELCTLDF